MRNRRAKYNAFSLAVQSVSEQMFLRRFFIVLYLARHQPPNDQLELLHYDKSSLNQMEVILFASAEQHVIYSVKSVVKGYLRQARCGRSGVFGGISIRRREDDLTIHNFMQQFQTICFSKKLQNQDNRRTAETFFVSKTCSMSPQSFTVQQSSTYQYRTLQYHLGNQVQGFQRF